MKNNDKGISEFENLLKDKIDELASSVDCFDKISKKAFPEDKIEFSDSEYTISSLENVTGQKRGLRRFIPAAAVAVAAVFCIALIPKDSLISSFLAKISGSDKETYRELISEINEEVDNGDYIYFDCTLEEYIANDVIITPLYSCPFEENDKDNINVRIFVKMYGELPTNQIYAVQYEGDFSEANYIAAADSKAKFTDQELDSKCSDTAVPYVRGYALELAEKAVKLDGYLSFDGNFPDYVSSYSYSCLYKYNNVIYPIGSEIITYTKTEKTDTFYFDYISMYLNAQGETVPFDTSAFEDSWDNVVYFNGCSARAEKDSSASCFERTDIASDTKFSGIFNSEIVSVTPDITDEDAEQIFVYSGNEAVGYGKIPINPTLRSQMRLYCSYPELPLEISFDRIETSSGTLHLTEPDSVEEERELFGTDVHYKNGFIDGYTDFTVLNKDRLEELNIQRSYLEEELAGLESILDDYNEKKANFQEHSAQSSLTIGTSEDEYETIEAESMELETKISAIKEKLNSVKAEIDEISQITE